MPSTYRPKNTAYRNQPHSGKKAPPTGTDDDLNGMVLARLFASEDAAREFLESKRWPNGPVCPHCRCQKAYKLTAKPDSKHPVRPGVYKCKDCRKQFSVRVGTIFEDSKIPICKWLFAIHLMTSSKKGVSSHQIARELGITVKSAWFVTHRIRESMKLEPMAGMLSGVVEADETYVGGKPRWPNTGKTGRGTKKQAVMVLVQREGAAIATPIYGPSSTELKGPIRQFVVENSTIITDEFASYQGLDKTFGHYTVNHGRKEYARREGACNINTNTAESFFALLKRGHYGIFHHLSKKHIERYCTEFAFRWTNRKVSDGQRMVNAIKGAEGKRLTYRQPKEAKGKPSLDQEPQG